ncbi:hypothetical protein AB1Y20_023044 [Prymnesium parvum]|uniref:Mitochondrial carrier protein n=1 Tax=Prymnesium parvum TaxID=97485 RepID=A0AB34JCQ5_PRYPA
MQADSPPCWIGFVAGVVAGGSGVIAGHAFDTLKVQAQSGQKFAPPSDGGRGLLAHARFLRSLYRGILPPLLSTGAVRSLYFGIFENVSAATSARREGSQTLGEIFTAGALTGGLVSPITSPFVVLKIRQQVEGGSMVDLIRRLGVNNLWRGLPVHFALETVGSGVYLTTYAAAKRAVTRSQLSGTEHVEFPALKILCGAVSGIMGWVSIYPLDVLRTRIMSGMTTDPPRGTSLVLAAFQECYKEGGLQAFLRGLGPTLLRAAPVAGVVLPVYDGMLTWLKSITAERR